IPKLAERIHFRSCHRSAFDLSAAERIAGIEAGGYAEHGNRRLTNSVPVQYRRGFQGSKKHPAFSDFSSFFKFCAVYKKSLKNYGKVFYALAYMAREQHSLCVRTKPSHGSVRSGSDPIYSI